VEAGSNRLDDRCVCCTIRGERPIEVPVETLAIGDKLVTMSGAARRIKWIEQRSYAGRFVLGLMDILPICIKAVALDVTDVAMHRRCPRWAKALNRLRDRPAEGPLVCEDGNQNRDRR
jgi:hypothetical protein